MKISFAYWTEFWMQGFACIRYPKNTFFFFLIQQVLISYPKNTFLIEMNL